MGQGPNISGVSGTVTINRGGQSTVVDGKKNDVIDGKAVPKATAAKSTPMQPKKSADAAQIAARANKKGDSTFVSVTPKSSGRTQVSVSVGGSGSSTLAHKNVGGVDVAYQPGKNVPNRLVSVGGSTFSLSAGSQMSIGDKIRTDGEKLFVNGQPVSFD